MKGKITLIGAGSGMFSLNLVRDLCLTKSLEDCEVCMMDISPERLGSVYEFCVRYAGELGSKLKVSKTLDRKEALRGADFVINTALAAPYGRLRAGWEIGERYGYRFGGSLQIMHDEAFWINFYQFGLMEDILLDMRAVCPDAWYLIVANPVVTGVTYLKRKYPDSKIVGMCHGFAGIYRWCDKLNIRREDISFESIGVNHFVFLNRFFHKGENAYPLIDKWIGDESQSYFDKVWYSDFEGPMAVDIYRKYGLWPVGDTATPGGGSWPWWYHTDDEIQERWREKPVEGYLGYFGWVESQAKLIRDNAFNRDVKLTELFPASHSGEPVIPLIEALHCGVERTVIVNILNDGEYIEGIPRDFQVEIPALCSRKGIQGVKCNPLPKHILSFIYREKIAPCEMELAAYGRGSYDLLLAMVLMDPFSKSEAQARGFLDEILAMPQHGVMRGHYKR